ncbi:MAG: 3-deoxy-D-manno-octulosonic acid transferase [Acidobacteriota bacterium]
MVLRRVNRLLEYRAHMVERFGRLSVQTRTRLDAMTRRPVWIQAVSVGEVMLAQALVDAVGSAASNGSETLPFVLSSTTPAGRDLAMTMKRSGFESVFHFPIDWPPFVRRTLSAVRPCSFISIETEIWPVLLGECVRRRIPALVVNGRISERSRGRYLRLGTFLRKRLQAIRMACMQSDADAERIRDIGLPAERIVVTGNMKFDMVPRGPAPQDLARMYAKAGSSPIVVAGSTSAGEEELILEALERTGRDEVLLILAPRHRARFDAVADLLRGRGIRFARRSRAGRGEDAPPPVLLLDTLGELGRVYSLATVAFVGGSLVPRGGQNLVEPAAWGIPVLFGPHTENFQAVAEALLACGAGRRVGGADSLAAALLDLIDDERARREAGLQGLRLVEKHRGATDRTVRHILPLLAA